MKASRITAVGLVAVTAVWILSGYLLPHESAESKAALQVRETKTEKRFRVAVIHTTWCRIAAVACCPAALRPTAVVRRLRPTACFRSCGFAAARM